MGSRLNSRSEVLNQGLLTGFIRDLPRLTGEAVHKVIHTERTVFYIQHNRLPYMYLRF